MIRGKPGGYLPKSTIGPLYSIRIRQSAGPEAGGVRIHVKRKASKEVVSDLIVPAQSLSGAQRGATLTFAEPVLVTLDPTNAQPAAAWSVVWTDEPDSRIDG